MTIARIWHGRVTSAKAAAYLKLMREVALPDYRATPGNLGAWCLTRREDDVVHFEMLTFWEDIVAIRRFAGEEYDVAKYYDFDSEYLMEKEPRVRHYDAADR
jgi:hypothetical protein